MLPLSAWIQVAGAVQLAIGLANLPLARRLQYRKSLAGVSAMVRQVFYVHAAYIVLVVLGFAAQKTLGNVLAGIQIALTQPLLIDDIVVVEGEFGQIEEITLTYVTVRTWDLRRMILPITYFIEKPFQNWSRVSTELLGTVMLYSIIRCRWPSCARN